MHLDIVEVIGKVSHLRINHWSCVGAEQSAIRRKFLLQSEPKVNMGKQTAINGSEV